MPKNIKQIGNNHRKNEFKDLLCCYWIEDYLRIIDKTKKLRGPSPRVTAASKQM
jgi:hypothetical protein